MPTLHPGGRSARTRAWLPSSLLALALGLALLALYWPAVGYDMIFLDDPIYLVTTGILDDGLTWRGVVKAFSSITGELWVPVTLISFMVDVSVFGSSLAGLHLVNILLHALAMALLFLVLWRMTGARGRSFAAASLVALHPLRVESVAWIVERKDVLAVCFLLLAVASYVRFLRSRRAPWYGLVLVFTALGLMSKPILVTLPFLLLVCDFWPLGRMGPGGAALRSSIVPLLREKVPLLGLALAVSVVTIFGDWQTLEKPADGVGLFQRLENLSLTLVHYLVKTAYPVDLHLELAHRLSDATHAGEAILAATLLLVVTAATIRLARVRPWLAAGWLWYLTALLPNSRLLPGPFFSRGDRYTYLPHVGLAILLTWAFADFARKRRSGGAAAVAALGLCCVFGVMTRNQLPAWRDSVAVLQRSLQAEPGGSYLHFSLASVLLDQGRRAEAEAEARLAIRTDPTWASPHRLLGFLQAADGRTAEALASYEQALRLRDLILEPGAQPAAATHLEYALLLDSLGRREEALEHHRTAVSLVPTASRPRRALADSLAGLGKLAEAVEQYRAYLRLETDPRQAARGHLALGRLFQESGAGDDAVREYRAAIAQDPELAEAWFAMGVLLVNQGKTADGLASYQEARKLAPGSIPLLLNLAEVQFRSGHAAEARAGFAEIARRYPGSAEAVFSEGRLRELAGDRDGAAERYGKVGGTPPAYPGSAEALARILGAR